MPPDFLTIESGAHEAATSPHNQRKPPSDAQAKAGNYKMGRMCLHGLDIAIENPRGTYRSGRNPDTGLRWTSRLAAHYGYFPGTVGNDGDPVDCFVGEWIYSDRIYVINQHFGEKFDEHKVMVGFADEESAKIAYQLSFNQGWSCLKSITPCTITQFRWWLKNGNMKKPLYPDHLPHEGTNTMQMIHWTPDANPANIEIGRLLYNMRKDSTHEQGDLVMDAATLADVEADMAEWADEVITLDAIVVEYKDLTKRLQVMQKAMNRVGALKVTGFDASRPVTKAGATHIAAVFALSDGQTLSIYFHNPDTTPTKIALTDELISWKNLLNKKDVTIAVAPESGKVMAEVDVAKRMMKLAEKNSAAFLRQSERNAGKAANIEALNTEITGLEKELSGKQKRLEVAKMAATVAPKQDHIKEEPIATSTDTQTPAQNAAAVVAAQPEAKPATAFTPTHELPDGTPVTAHPDEQGVWVDAEGDEHETDNASPIGGMDFDKRLKNLKDRRQQGVAENPLPEHEHYSKKILKTLVSSHGWSASTDNSVLKDVGGGLTGGEANPEGKRTVYAAFDELGRYLTLQSGWDNVLDVDCRDGHGSNREQPALSSSEGNDQYDIDEGVKRLAAYFNTKVDEWAEQTSDDNPIAPDPKIETQPTEKPATMIEQAMGHTVSGLNLNIIDLQEKLNNKGIQYKTHDEYQDEINKGEKSGFSIKGLNNDLSKYRQDLSDVISGEKTPQSVIGKGYKNPRLAATNWLNQQISLLESAIKDNGKSYPVNTSNYEYYLSKTLNDANQSAPEAAKTLEATSEPEADPYAVRIEALRTMPRSEYDDAIDALIEELEAAGVMDRYEDVLNEIDTSRTHELQDMVAKATGGKTLDSATSPTSADLMEMMQSLGQSQAEAVKQYIDKAISDLVAGR